MAKYRNRDVEDIDEAALLQSIYEQSNPPAADITAAKAPAATVAAAKEPVVVKEPVPEQQEQPAQNEQQEQPAQLEQQEQPERPKEPTRRRRGNVDYSSLFLQKNELKTRSCVYISQRIHTMISEIVRFIADKDVTVGGYIDNVLLQHLEAHKDEINGLYKRERKDLIEL